MTWTVPAHHPDVRIDLKISPKKFRCWKTGMDTVSLRFIDLRSGERRKSRRLFYYTILVYIPKDEEYYRHTR